MNEELSELSARVEAVLFAYGEPLARSKLASLLKISEEECDAALAACQSELESQNRGVTLLNLGPKVQLVTKPGAKGFLESFLKEELREDLTPAALETLSIIAYFGPIARPKIEYVRGVNSSFTLRGLRIRGLVERQSDPAHPASSFYDITSDFLKHMGISRREDLPDFGKFAELWRNFESGAGVGSAPGKIE